MKYCNHDYLWLEAQMLFGFLRSTIYIFCVPQMKKFQTCMEQNKGVWLMTEFLG